MSQLLSNQYVMEWTMNRLWMGRCMLSTEMEHLLDRLSPMLPGVRVWIDWCLCHAEMWNQPFFSTILNFAYVHIYCIHVHVCTMGSLCIVDVMCCFEEFHVYLALFS